jgi:hypothetical protein
MQMDPSEAAALFRAETINHTRTPFDLRTGPVMRILVIKKDKDDYFVIETAHHSIMDRVSFLEINRDLLGLYQEKTNGKPFDHHAAAIPYFDFVVRQRRWVDENRTNLRRFWSNYLEGISERPSLPYDRDPSLTDSADGAHYSFILEDDLAIKLVALARKKRMTLVTLLLGAYAALLYERTGARDIVIGLPSATRGETDTRRTVGFLLTNTPVRVKIPDEPTLDAIVMATRSARMDVSGFEETPFTEIVEAAAPRRRLNQYPLLRSLFLCVDFEEVSFSFDGVKVSVIAVSGGVSPMDITLGFWKSGSKIHGRFEYRTSLFFKSTIESLATRLLEILSDLADGLTDAPVVKTEVGSSAGIELPIRTDTSTQMPVSAADASSSAILATVWQEVLGVKPISSSDFFDSGGNSLLILKMTKSLRDRGYSLSARDVLMNTAFDKMVQRLTPIEQTRNAITLSECRATPDQVRFLDSALERPELWAHSWSYGFAFKVDAGRLFRAVEAVCKGHSALSGAVHHTDAGWMMSVGNNWSWRQVDEDAEEANVVEAQRRELNLGSGPLFCVTLINGSSQSLVVTASHLIIDGVSWSVFEDELSAAYEQNGLDIEEVSFLTYASTLLSRSFASELEFWREQIREVGPFPYVSNHLNLIRDEQSLRRIVPLPLSSHHYEAESLAAVANALRQVGSPVVVDVVGSGRELFPELPAWNPARAIGNYACLFPLRLDVGGTSLLTDFDVVDKALRDVPFGGRGFGILQSDPNMGLKTARPQVSLNYLGRLGENLVSSRLLRRRNEYGPSGNLSNSRSHIINVDVALIEQGIQFTWRYNPNVTSIDVVRPLIERTAENIVGLAAPSTKATRGGRIGVMESEINAYFAELRSDARDN